MSITKLQKPKKRKKRTHDGSKDKTIIKAPDNHINPTRSWKNSLARAFSWRLRRHWWGWNFKMICTHPTASFPLRHKTEENMFVKSILSRNKFITQKYMINGMNIVKSSLIILTCDLRNLGIQIIALPSREHVTMLSCVNLEWILINKKRFEYLLISNIK